MAKKLNREPVQLKSSSKVSDLYKFNGYVLDLAEEGEIDASYLSRIDQSEEIFKYLCLYLRKYTKKRSIATVVLRFLFFVAERDGAIGENSINFYLKNINNSQKKGSSTKYQESNKVLNFIYYLFEHAVIPVFRISEKMKNPGPETTKKTFPDIVAPFLDSVLKDKRNEIVDHSEKTGISEFESKSYVYSVATIEIIHKCSIEKINNWEVDWNIVTDIISSIKKSEIEELRLVKNFDESFGDDRTLEEAFLTLYSEFGMTIPAASNWVDGLQDYLSVRGWSTTRVRRAFVEGVPLTEDQKYITDFIKCETSKPGFRKVKLKCYKRRSKKSFALAIKVLYSKFGRLIPSTKHWPTGLSDYLKRKGWSATRVAASFFPNSSVNQWFYLMMLSHKELALNSDSAVYYVYHDCLTPSFEEGTFDILVRKVRGGFEPKSLPKKDDLVEKLSAHIDRMKVVMKTFSSGRAWLNKEHCPLFLNFSEQYEDLEVRLPDPSSVTSWVKRAIKLLSLENPLLVPLVPEASGDNFRPTVVLIHKFSGKSMEDLQGLLSHKRFVTTDRYVNRVEVDSLVQNKYLSFQNYLVNESSQAFERTGVGVYCNSVEQNNEKPCGNLELCLQCEAKRVVLASAELAAEWLAWASHIVENEDEVRRNNLDRWLKYWEPRLQEYLALIKMAPDHVLEEAQSISNKIKLPKLS